MSAGSCCSRASTRSPRSSAAKPPPGGGRQAITFATRLRPTSPPTTRPGRTRRTGTSGATRWATYAYPVIGRLPVAEVDTGLVLRVLQPIWTTKSETAARVRMRIERILSWATVQGYRSGDNPARWDKHLDNLLPRAGEVAPGASIMRRCPMPRFRLSSVSCTSATASPPRRSNS